jgi:hypothetical protein
VKTAPIARNGARVISGDLIVTDTETRVSVGVFEEEVDLVLSRAPVDGNNVF